MDFTTRQLRAFHTVARFRSFARAAEALFITPSGLSALVRELETQAGFRLFHRTTRSVTLTEQGMALFPVSERLLNELDTLLSALNKSTRSNEQHLSVGTTPAWAANVMAGAIAKFHREHPDAVVTLVDGTMDVILDSVKGGTLDIGLGVYKASPGLKRSFLFSSSYVFITPKDEKHFNDRPVSWSELIGRDLIVLPPSYPHQQLIDEQLSASSVAVRYVSVVNYLDTQIAMVEAGIAAAVIPAFALPACRNRQVHVQRLTDPASTLDFHQISQPGRALPAVAKEFSFFLKDYVKDWLNTTGLKRDQFRLGSKSKGE